MLSLEETIEQILKHLPQYDREAILVMIREKREELGADVINEESAAMIVARELGVDLSQESSGARFRIDDITEGTRSVTLTAKVVEVGTVRTFTRKDGTEGKVASVIIADDTGRIRVALWDDMTQAISDGHVTLGSFVQVRGAYVKKGFRDALELNLGRMGGIRVLEDYEADDVDFDVTEADIAGVGGLQDGMFDVTVLVKVVRAFRLSTFTRKKDGNEGKVLSIIGADESGSIRVVFWDNLAEEMDDVQPGEVIRVTQAYTRTSQSGLEVHSSRSSAIERDIKGKLKDVEGTEVTSSFAEALGRKTITELTPDMKDVDVEGKVTRLFPANEWEKEDRKGRVQNIFIHDESGGELRITFWNDDVDKIADLQVGDVIRIKHGYVREREGRIEYQVSRRSEIEINPENTELADLEITDAGQQTLIAAERIIIRNIDESSEGRSVEISGLIVGVSNVSPIYPACPECGKKLTEKGSDYFCQKCDSEMKPEHRVAFKITLDDGTGSPDDDSTGSIKVMLFGRVGEKLLGVTAQEAHELIEKSGVETEPIDVSKDMIIGKHVTVQGRVSKYRGEIEITASRLVETDLKQAAKLTREDLDKH